MDKNISVRSRFVHVTTQSGEHMRLPVRYVQMHGICVECAPVEWSHRQSVSVALAYLRDGQVHVLKTHASIDRKQVRGTNLRLSDDRYNGDLLKALAQASVVDDVFCAQGVRLISQAMPVSMGLD